ncbi:MAG: flagellar type III secretion system pore protein FliP [Solidesulfovibrio sp. DCME]|uniref:flagellar type III secretion system pore protein FliP n=1 Tax=Solidesulfovibrio sp. DCME TaxID=3447380 RepID=UPI003D13779E
MMTTPTKTSPPPWPPRQATRHTAAPAPALRPSRPAAPALRLGLTALALALAGLCLAAPALAQDAPTLSLNLAAGQNQPERVATLLEILFALTVLSLAPSFVLMVTSFTRIIVVFSFLRQAMGVPQVPPSQILASLAIFLTCVIMYPTGRAIYDNALNPYLEERIGFTEALKQAEIPLREFLFKHTREKDLSVFYTVTKMERPKDKAEVPTLMLAAGFMISELKTAFTIGFLIYIPFLILDMVISSILLAMGMMMLPPATIAMPFKLLLFVLVDGWGLMVASLVNSFAT